jgi:hypothetical protein
MMPQTIESAAGGYVTTAIRIPRDVLTLLRQMAVDRATRCGCRVSVSGVLADLALERRQKAVREQAVSG